MLGHCSAHRCWEAGTAWHSRGGSEGGSDCLAGLRGRGQKLGSWAERTCLPAAGRLEAVDLLWGLLSPAAQNPVPSMGPTEPALPMEMLGSKHRLERRKATSMSMCEQSCELLCMWLRGSCLCNLHRLEWGRTPTPAATGNPPPRPPLIQRMNSHRGVPPPPPCLYKQEKLSQSEGLMVEIPRHQSQATSSGTLWSRPL